MLERPLPDPKVGRHDEVGQHEDECLHRKLPPVLAEEVEPAGHGVGGRAERAVVGAGLGSRLRPRSPPERLALGEVEVAGEAACRERARPDQVDGCGQGARLVERPELRCGNRHRRPAVAEADDAGRLVREALPDDELVGAARR